MANNTNFTDQEYENFRMYHSLQYDRMDKLENRRESFSNIVLTVSLAVVAFGFSSESSLNPITAFFAMLVVLSLNAAGIMFAKRSWEFFKMHQKRAKHAREKYAPVFNEINALVGKRDSEKDPFSRPKLYGYLHWITMGVVLASFCSFVFYPQPLEDKCCQCDRDIDKTSTKSDSISTLALPPNSQK